MYMYDNVACNSWEARRVQVGEGNTSLLVLFLPSPTGRCELTITSLSRRVFGDQTAIAKGMWYCLIAD